MSKLALTLSPSFFGVRTMLVHQSVGLSPISSMMSKSCHLSMICWNLSFRVMDTLLFRQHSWGIGMQLYSHPFKFPYAAKNIFILLSRSCLLWLAIPLPAPAAVLLWSARCDIPGGPYFQPPVDSGAPCSLDHVDHVDLDVLLIPADGGRERGNLCQNWSRSIPWMTSYDCLGWLQTACTFETLKIFFRILVYRYSVFGTLFTISLTVEFCDLPCTTW